MLDQDYDLMGLSRHNAIDEESFLFDNEGTSPLIADLNEAVGHDQVFNDEQPL